MSLASKSHIKPVAIAVVALVLGVGTAAFAVNEDTEAPPRKDSTTFERARYRTPIMVDGAPGSSLEGIGPAVTAKIATYVAEVQATAAANEQARLEAEIALKQAQAAELERQGAVLQQASRAVASSGGGSTSCAIPQYICDRESGGNPTVYNHQGSGASGKYQFMPRTWNGYEGYANAADAPEAVQDAKAAELWAGGAGCSHWSAC